MSRLSVVALAMVWTTTTSLSAYAQRAEPHGWLNTETLKTRSGNFEFRGGASVCKVAVQHVSAE